MGKLVESKKLIEDYIKKYGKSQYAIKRDFEKYIKGARENKVDTKTIRENLKYIDRNIFRKWLERNRKAIDNYEIEDFKFVGESFQDYISKFYSIEQTEQIKKILNFNSVDMGRLLTKASIYGRKVDLKELYYGDNGTHVEDNPAPIELVEKLIDFLPGENRKMAKKFLKQAYKQTKHSGGSYEESK